MPLSHVSTEQTANGAPLIDHDFESPTYQEPLQNGLEDFLKRHGGIK